MNPNKRILIAIDNSEASMRAVAYVATIIDDRRDFEVRLFHVLAPLPSEILEIPWVDTPELAKQAKAEFREARARWIEKEERAAQAMFARARAILLGVGVLEETIQTQVAASFETQEIISDILDTARTNQYGTVVVGRETFSGLQEMIHQHVGDRLVPHGQGLTFWVVE